MTFSRRKAIQAAGAVALATPFAALPAIAGDWPIAGLIDPLVALDIEHREVNAAWLAASGTGDLSPEQEALGDRQCDLVDQLANTPATSWEGVLVKLRYVFEYLDGTSDIGAVHSFQRDAIEAIERFAMPAAESPCVLAPAGASHAGGDAVTPGRRGD